MAGKLNALVVALGLPSLLVGIWWLARIEHDPPNAMPRNLAWQAYRDAKCHATRRSAETLTFDCADGKTYTASTLDEAPADWSPPDVAAPAK